MADETRTERTDFAGMLALYNADGRSQRWGWPYWGPVQMDAFLAALHDAPRDGVPLITAPAAPTLAGLATGGHLLTSTTYEVVQTFVDEYGRETEASTPDTVVTAAAIVDPAVAASLAVASAAAGFAGGLFEVWYSWTDADWRETASSPVVSTNLPYLASPLLNEVTVTLPATPASEGAAGANIYIRHRSGNTVLAAVITTDSETEVVLDGTISNCSMDKPTVNSTGATAAIEITGAAVNGTEAPAFTRFYIRKDGQTWTDADRRLKLGGVDEWDPATVSYPLTFTGVATEMAPGYPPTVSQVKSIRPIHLPTEAIGDLASNAAGAFIGWGLIDGQVVELATPGMGARVLQIAYSDGYGTIYRKSSQTGFVASLIAADATDDRIDLVCLSDTGEIVSSGDDANLAGIPGSPPIAVDAQDRLDTLGDTVDEKYYDYVPLAEIDVAATVTAIYTADITDVRVVTLSLQDMQGNAGSDITDASESHALNAVFDDTEVEGALNALGQTVNEILTALRNSKIIRV